MHRRNNGHVDGARNLCVSPVGREGNCFHGLTNVLGVNHKTRQASRVALLGTARESVRQASNRTSRCSAAQKRRKTWVDRGRHRRSRPSGSPFHSNLARSETITRPRDFSCAFSRTLRKRCIMHRFSSTAGAFVSGQFDSTRGLLELFFLQMIRANDSCK